MRSYKIIICYLLLPLGRTVKDDYPHLFYIHIKRHINKSYKLFEMNFYENKPDILGTIIERMQSFTLFERTLHS